MGGSIRGASAGDRASVAGAKPWPSPEDGVSPRGGGPSGRGARTEQPPSARLERSASSVEHTAPPADPLLNHPDNPRRPTDWRWRRAVLMADGRIKPSRRLDDSWALRAMRLEAALRGCRDESRHEALRKRMPETHGAHSVFADPDPLRRWSLEARILSGEAFGVIAGRFGLDEGVIAAYEKIFFDIIDHPGTDYVALIAVGLPTGMRPPDLGTVWRWFGYHGGPYVLDFLLGTHSTPLEPRSQKPFGEFATDHVRGELLKKVATAVLTMRVDNHAAPKVLDLYLRSLKEEQRVRESAPILESIRPNVTAMWDSLPPLLKAGSEPSKAGPRTGALTPGAGDARP